VSVNGNGQVAVVWSRSDGANSIIEVSTSTLSSAPLTPSNFWASPIDLSEAGTDALYPQLTLDSSGNAVVAWQYGTTASYAIQAVVGTSLFE
jgi:hypothetical protein